MIRKILCVLLLGYSTVVVSKEASTGRVIDIGKRGVSCIPGYTSLDLDVLEQEYEPFGGAIEFCAYFSYLQDIFHIDTAIETGTGEGKTAAFLGFLFDEVHTMEIDVSAFHQALLSLRTFPNIVVHYGHSPDILRQTLSEKKDKFLLFYLDAHSTDYWPLLEELEVISQTHRDNCIIVINDCKVPGRSDIPYGVFKGAECSLRHFKGYLDKVYSNYYYYYVIPKSVDARAKFVAIPKRQEYPPHWLPE